MVLRQIGKGKFSLWWTIKSKCPKYLFAIDFVFLGLFSCSTFSLCMVHVSTVLWKGYILKFITKISLQTLKEDQRLRLLQTFAGVLQKKSYLGCFLRKPSEIIHHIEGLWNVEFNKIIFCFVKSFSKVAEAIDTQTTDSNSGELIGYPMRSLMQKVTVQW